MLFWFVVYPLSTYTCMSFFFNPICFTDPVLDHDFAKKTQTKPRTKLLQQRRLTCGKTLNNWGVGKWEMALSNLILSPSFCHFSMPFKLSNSMLVIQFHHHLHNISKGLLMLVLLILGTLQEFSCELWGLRYALWKTSGTTMCYKSLYFKRNHFLNRFTWSIWEPSIISSSENIYIYVNLWW